jgi:CheY-like chemotaxis protein
MLIEDDEGIREIFADVLREEGYEVRAYGNGREALDALERAEVPTLILLDWMMPVMTGQEFMQSDLGAAASKHSPVVVISAVAKHLSNIPGIREFLIKPIDLDVLLQTVNRYCAAEVA